MLLDVANEQHIGIFVFFAIINQLQYILKMLLKLFSGFELHVWREKVIDVRSWLISYIEAYERQSTKPNDHRSFEIEPKKDQDLTNR